MATRFEIVLPGDPSNAGLRAAGEEALHAIQHLEARLSFYSHHSEISALNAHAASHAVKVEPGLFELLQLARRIHDETHGAFDITVAPLMRCWGLTSHTPDRGRVPSPEQLQEARARVGMHLVELDPDHFTVRFLRPGVLLDLGAIGKGYAIDVAADSLRENGVTSAFLHGGTSTACAIGSPPDQDAWKIAIDPPQPLLSGQNTQTLDAPVCEWPTAPTLLSTDASLTPATRPLAVVPLRDQSLSVSAIWGKSFQSDNRFYGHILDPRSGQPVSHTLLAAVVLPCATETDAFSTALLVEGAAALDAWPRFQATGQSLVISASDNPGAWTVSSRGITPLSPPD